MPLPDFPPLPHDIRTDVLIVGGGLAGLLTAYQLRKSGVDCVLVDGSSIMSSVSSNTTGKITAQHGLIYHQLLSRFGEEWARLYYHANCQALEAYRRLAAGIDCDYSQEDNYIYSSRSPEKIEEEAAALLRLGIRSDYVNHIDLPVPCFGAIRFHNQAQFHPRKLATGILDDLTVYEQTRVLKIQGHTAQTNRGKIHAEKIVIATHFPIVNSHGSYFMKLCQSRSYVMALKNAPSPRGMYLDEDPNGFSFRRWGDYLLLGGENHRTAAASPGWRNLEAFAQKHYPDSEISYRWASQDCMSLDGIPYIGRYSKGTPHLYVATGFNKWGMTNSMVSALILRDLILDRKNPCAKVFSPSRAMVYPQLFRNCVESVRHMLTLKRPRCPHLGCSLTWNPAEHSWDCGCHGSRFDAEGKLLNEPATKDLPIGKAPES